MTEQAAPQDFRGLTRADVTQEAARALEGLRADDRAAVQGHAPSVILGVAFLRAQTAWCADGRKHTADEEAAYHRTANLASAAMIFERADDPEAAADAMATYQRMVDAERTEEARSREEAYARLLAAQWAGAEERGGYLVRTEERGHGIVAVYAKGPGNDVNGTDRARAGYARSLGLEPGGSAGGGEFTDAGRTYISQCTYRRA